MTRELQQLLHEIGDEQAPVAIDPSTYQRGRRSHRRTTAAVVVAVCASVCAVLVGVTGIREERAAPPVSNPRGAAFPSTVYSVPDRFTSCTETGCSWDEPLRSDTLAVGTTALAFAPTDGPVVAVSALDGGYRGLELPGFDSFSATFGFLDAVFALSPDGTRLAYTWNPSVAADEPVQRSGIRIVDLETGTIRDYAMESEFGVVAHGLGWSPDGRFLAYNLQLATNADGRVRGARHFTVERLDTRTGARLRADLPSGEGTVAVSNLGEVAVNDNLGVLTWLPGREPERRRVPGLRNAFSMAWSSDGRLATGASDLNQPYVVWAGSPEAMRARDVPEDTDQHSAMRAMGWVDSEVVVLRTLMPSGSVLTGVGPDGRSRTLSSGPGLPGPYGDISIATDLLARTGDFPAPDWPTDWQGPALWLGAAGVVVLLLLAVGAVRRRRYLS